jgi:DNA-binding CsgD family transcriptional regulator
MLMLDNARALAEAIVSSSCRPELGEMMAQTCQPMGFQYFALSHHPQSWHRRDSDLHLHNYPAEWARCYDRRRLALSDPIHRASHVHAAGFRWDDVPAIIPVTERDRAMLAEARAFGIADGFTVPTNVPGEQYGSVTFATHDGDSFPDAMLLFAEALGHLAFQTARVIDGQRPALKKACVTDRQLEIVILIGRDKTDGEMAQILGVKEDTITKHVRNICERFDATKRTSVPLRAVFAGLISFSDIFFVSPLLFPGMAAAATA